MPYSFYSKKSYRKSQAERTKELWREGVYSSLRKPLDKRFCKNPDCKRLFEIKSFEPNIYCSHSCSATITNTYRKSIRRKCLNCTDRVKGLNRIYCSNICKNIYLYENYILAWKKGLKDGNRGKATIALSKHLRRYIIEKFGAKCSICEWGEKNPITNIIALEIDHIDGNHMNNKEENLRLLCPNCHALTPNFRNLNKGNGRAWRLKYIAANNI